jgi:plasmid maintenance system killer protein
MKLDRLEAAAMVKDLAALVGNRFVSRRYSIRINDFVDHH